MLQIFKPEMKLLLLLSIFCTASPIFNEILYQAPKNAISLGFRTINKELSIYQILSKEIEGSAFLKYLGYLRQHAAGTNYTNQ